MHENNSISNSGDSALFATYPDILSVKQLQSALQIGRNKAYALIKNNTVKHFKVGNDIKIPKQFLIDYVVGACYNQSCNRQATVMVEEV